MYTNLQTSIFRNCLPSLHRITRHCKLNAYLSNTAKCPSRVHYALALSSVSFYKKPITMLVFPNTQRNKYNMRADTYTNTQRVVTFLGYFFFVFLTTA